MRQGLFMLFIVASLTSFCQHYVIFLHNRFVEEQGPFATHPDYGPMEYEKILNYFKTAGFKVLSEIRPPDTNAGTFATKVARQADSLIKSGVSPSHICIVGTSKGGYIAMETSALLKNAAINYVTVGNCSPGKNTVLYGKLLVIREKSDSQTEACTLNSAAKNCCLGEYKELELNTGLKHGFQFKALAEWLLPCSNWARH